MALHAGTLNNTKPVHVATVLWNFVTALVAAGYTIPASGDGVSTYSRTGSVFTTPDSTGAGGWANTNAWVRIKYPAAIAAGREMLITNYSTSGITWRVSASAGFITGGSATTVPTAADQQTVVAGLSWQNGTDGATYTQALADDASGFAFLLSYNTAGTNTGFLGVEVLSGLSTGPGGSETDPLIHMIGSGSSALTSNPSNCSGYAFGSWVTMKMTPLTAVTNTGGNPSGSGDDLIPVQVSASTGAAPHFKGYTTNYLFDLQSASRSNLQWLDSGGAKFLASNIGLPWNGTTMLTG